MVGFAALYPPYGPLDACNWVLVGFATLYPPYRPL